ncbi:hypothetical protein F511_39829 [Dorcoceras hygrometricum]|uniref:Uncharacterized protein n=1 Tax=Dorcoceras hygrometricum TaxID=472368 RepID=A0A2Z7CUH4_9LAMI|nr:hypothetical protein F511_39829 [Dorcoceras hygrometricum]
MRNLMPGVLAHRLIFSEEELLPPLELDEEKLDYGGRCMQGRDTASRGPTTIVTPKSQFRTDPSDHGKASSNIAP